MERPDASFPMQHVGNYNEEAKALDKNKEQVNFSFESY